MKPKDGSRGTRQLSVQARSLGSLHSVQCLHAEIKDEPQCGDGCEADAKEGACPPRYEWEGLNCYDSLPEIKKLVAIIC